MWSSVSISQEEGQLLAAEIAGLSRAEFILALGRYGVSPFQQTSDELLADIRRLDQLENRNAR